MMRRHPMVAIGIAMLGLALLSALFAPWIAPLGRTSPGIYEPPGAAHWFGTDDGGHDILSLFLHGARVSLIIGCFATLISVVVGGLVGLLAGYFGGRLENALMRLTDVFLVIPDLPLIIALVAVIGPGMFNIIFAIGLVGWTGTARLVRAQTLSVKHRKFVVRARAIGAGHGRIIMRHILPVVMPLIVANTVLVLSLAILNESTLSFLGLGDAAAISWGQMLHLSFTRGAMSAGAWWALMPPGFGIVWVVLGCALLGHGLEHAFNPRTHAHHLMVGPDPVVLGQGKAPGDVALAVRDISVAYQQADAPPARALEGITFDLKRGEALGVVGESGCGKSTLLLALLRLLPAQAQLTGAGIYVGGRNVLPLSESEMAAVRWKEISMVFQSAMHALNPVHPVGHQIAEAVKMRLSGLSPADVDQRVCALLAQVGVPASRRFDYPHQFSGGMRQRAMIAMALACDPPVVCADEPTTALDVMNQAQVLDLLGDLCRQHNRALILVAHDLGVVARLCDRVMVMYGGVVVETGSADDVFHNPAHPYTQALIQATPDMTRSGPLASIPGSPPRLDALPPGCRFAPRCPLVMDACRTEAPTLRDIGADHQARCLLVETPPSISPRSGVR